MSTRLLHHACLLFLLTVAMLASLGCQKSGSGAGSTSEEEIRTAFHASLRALESGRPQAALKQMLGHAPDAHAWTRTEKTMIAHFQRASQAAVQQCAANLKLLSDAVELYRADEANAYRMPEKLADVVETGQGVPTCPAAGVDTYSAGYSPQFALESYVLACKGRHHATAGLRQDNPYLDPRFGVVTRTERSISWWPTHYDVELDAIECSGDRATVTVHEGTDSSAVLTLHLKKDKDLWALDTESFKDEGSSSLGLLLGTYFTALGSPAAVSDLDRTQCERNLQRVATALEEYSCEHDGGYPRSLADLVPRHLPGLPTCPGAQGEVQPSYVLTESDNYDMACAGRHPDIRQSNRGSSPSQVGSTP